VSTINSGSANLRRGVIVVDVSFEPAGAGVRMLFRISGWSKCR
jgi:hypothetical protein